MVTVVIPWRPHPSRLWGYAATLDWYRRNLPLARLISIDSADETFTLARCRNLGVDSAEGDVVIINDADTLPELDPLLHAIMEARTDGSVHLPYTAYHWLGPVGTAEFASGTPLETCDFELVHAACSGVYVTTPATWHSHGGQDERFTGWGYEDAAWYLAHETLLGSPPRRHPGHVYALNHDVQVRAGDHFEANGMLMQQYREAAGDRERMGQLAFHDSIASRARALPGF